MGDGSATTSLSLEKEEDELVVSFFFIFKAAGEAVAPDRAKTTDCSRKSKRGGLLQKSRPFDALGN
jgi:hypothetical protein